MKQLLGTLSLYPPVMGVKSDYAQAMEARTLIQINVNSGKKN